MSKTVHSHLLSAIKLIGFGGQKSWDIFAVTSHYDYDYDYDWLLNVSGKLQINFPNILF